MITMAKGNVVLQVLTLPLQTQTWPMLLLHQRILDRECRNYRGRALLLGLEALKWIKAFSTQIPDKASKEL